MASDEKQAWISLVVAVAGLVAHLAVVLGRAGDGPLTEVSYVAPMLWVVGLSVAAAVVLTVVAAVAAPEEAGKRDQRDREIERFGEHVGQSLLVIGGLVALVLAMAEVDHFWIANALFLGFALSAVLGAAARIGAYRGGLPPW